MLRVLQVFGVVLALAALLLACSKPRDTPEAEIERLLLAGEAAIQARSVDSLKDLISDHYHDAQGRDKKALLRTAFLLFQRGPIRLLRVGTEIDATTERGITRFTLHALQGHAAVETPLDLLPQRVRGFRVVLHLRWEGDAWRLQSMEGVE